MAKRTPLKVSNKTIPQTNELLTQPSSEASDRERLLLGKYRQDLLDFLKLVAQTHTGQRKITSSREDA